MDRNLINQAIQHQPPQGLNINRNFRRYKIDQKDINYWKRLFVSYIENEFWESGKKFVMTDILRPKILLCFNWVLGEQIDVSLNKGLLLRGDVGTGKSSILKATMRLAETIHFDLIPYKPIFATADTVAKDCADEIKWNRFKTSKLLFIDDIGYEPKKVYDMCPVAELVRERYDAKRITCFTTNFEMHQFRELYNASFEDKISQMCYIVKFEGESKR